MSDKELVEERRQALESDDGDISVEDEAQELLERAQLNDQTRELRATDVRVDDVDDPRQVTFGMRPVFGGPEVTESFAVPQNGSLRETPDLARFLQAFETDPAAVEHIGLTTIPTRYDSENGAWVPLLDRAIEEQETEETDRSLFRDTSAQDIGEKIRTVFTRAAPLATLVAQVGILAAGLYTGNYGAMIGASIVNIPATMILVTLLHGDQIEVNDVPQDAYMYERGSPFNLEADTLESTEAQIDGEEIDEYRQDYIGKAKLDVPEALSTCLAVASLNDEEGRLSIERVKLDEADDTIVVELTPEYGDITVTRTLNAPTDGTLLESPELIQFAQKAGVPPADLQLLEDSSVNGYYDADRGEWMLGDSDDEWDPAVDSEPKNRIKGPIEAFTDGLRNLFGK